MKRCRLLLMIAPVLCVIPTTAAVDQATIPHAEQAAQPSREPAAKDVPDGVEPSTSHEFRVGTYDSRLLALAYYRSAHGMRAFNALEEQLATARATADHERTRELEAKAVSLQNLSHQQVFGTLSIPNVLKAVAGDLETVARDAQVALLVSRWDVQFSDAQVKLVDLTPQLLELFEVDKATRHMLDEFSREDPAPIPIEDLLDPRD